VAALDLDKLQSRAQHMWLGR